MNTVPDTENIIVAVVLNNELIWYISDKEIWFLDYQKRIDAFKNKGYNINFEYIDEHRKKFLILDSNNAAEFLNSIKNSRVTVNELRESLLKNKNNLDDSWKYDYRPSLYVNFDEKTLYSNYSEPASYEDYVPNLWQTKNKEISDEIPIEKRFWIDLDSTNILREN